MGDNQSIFSSVGVVTSQLSIIGAQATSPIFIEKGVHNYPLGTAATAVGGMWGAVTETIVPATPKLADPVNPSHYKGDLVMRIIEHFGLEKDFYLANAIKYLLRHMNKAGLEDLKKARWYLDRKIARLEGKHQEGVK